MLNAYTTVTDLLIVRFLLLGEFTTSWLLVWLRDLDTIERKANKAFILEEFASLRKWIGCLVGNWLVVNTTLICIAYKWNTIAFVAEQHILYAMALFLAAKMCLLFICVLGADDWSLRPIVIKRGVSPW